MYSPRGSKEEKHDIYFKALKEELRLVDDRRLASADYPWDDEPIVVMRKFIVVALTTEAPPKSMQKSEHISLVYCMICVDSSSSLFYNL